VVQQQVNAPYDAFADAKDAYWKIVRDTLVEIQGFSTRAATDRVRTLRRPVESRTPPDHLSLVYHAEPFDVASDLARQNIRGELHKDAYRRIVARHDLDEDASAALRNHPCPPFS
jgi:hypothetical protein